MIELFMYLGVALAPIIFIFTYIYLKDEYEREPLKHLVISFVLGVLIAFPVVMMEDFLSGFLGVDTFHNVFNTAVYAIIVIAGSEEGFKYLALRWYMYRKEEFDEPYDGIMYAVAVSLGFAAIENILYVYNMGLEVGFLRMFTAVPGHAMFGVIMGYFVGRAKFIQSPRAAWFERMKGLIAAILFHGLYDFFLMVEDLQIHVASVAFVVLIVGIVLARRAMKIHQKESPHQ